MSDRSGHAHVLAANVNPQLDSIAAHRPWRVTWGCQWRMGLGKEKIGLTFPPIGADRSSRVGVQGLPHG